MTAPPHYRWFRPFALMLVWATTSVLFWASRHAPASIAAAVCCLCFAVEGVATNAPERAE